MEYIPQLLLRLVIAISQKDIEAIFKLTGFIGALFGILT